MNDNYQKYMDVTANERTRKNSKFYFDALDKYNIDVSSDNISSLEQLENIFVQLGFNSFNSIIGFRSLLKSYSIFINDKPLFNLIRKIDIYRILDLIQGNMKHTYLSQSEFQDVYNAIGAYDEDTFYYNSVYYQSLFWAVYVGIFNDGLSVLKNLRASDIDGNIITIRDDNGEEWELDIPEQLALDFMTLVNDSTWYRRNRSGVCKIQTEGLFYDSVFKVDIRTPNSKYSYSSTYYTMLRRIAVEYLGYTLAPKNLFMSGMINRIKEQYGKTDEMFVEGIKISDPVLVDIFNQEAKRCHYSVAFWNFRQTIFGRI